MKSFLFCLLFLTLAGCTHSLHQAHVSDFSPTFKKYEQGKLVKSRGEQSVVLGFIGETEFVDQAYQRLMKACPNGSIQGITTQYSTDHGFLSWTNRVDMQGLCIQ